MIRQMQVHAKLIGFLNIESRMDKDCVNLNLMPTYRRIISSAENIDYTHGHLPSLCYHIAHETTNGDQIFRKELQKAIKMELTLPEKQIALLSIATSFTCMIL